MKKILLLIMLCWAALSADAYDFMVDSLAYNINEDSTSVCVTYITQYDFHNYEGVTEIDVPAEIVYQGNTYMVTTIGDYAFNCCPDLQRVSLANTVTSVGRWAFDSCNKLEDINLGSVKKIGRAAFQYDKILQSITIPESVECIDTLLFQSCISLSNVNLPSTLKEIHRSAFYGCKSLTSIILPQSLENLEEAAFSTCTGLVSINLPSSLETIGQKIFYGCNSLTKIYSKIKEPQAIYCNADAFYYLPKSICTLCVPQGTIYRYLATCPWNTFISIMEIAKTDVNWDEAVNAADVTALYNYILNGDNTFLETSDVNGDGSINAADVTAVYNIILSSAQTESPTFTKYSINGVSFKMIDIVGGTFTMGCPENDDEAENYDKPEHLVTLSNYSIGETEVTQELWRAVMGLSPSHFYGDKLPVENVSWSDCEIFINKLNQITGMNFRMPTEAEWEYAASGGSKSKGYKYSGSDDLEIVAWYYGNSYFSDYQNPDFGTHDVGTKKPNELGLYDMSGNVYEWCLDYANNYQSEPQYNPIGEVYSNNRIMRGGGWNSEPQKCKVKTRSSNGHLGWNIGLRLAM